VISVHPCSSPDSSLGRSTFWIAIVKLGKSLVNRKSSNAKELKKPQTLRQLDCNPTCLYNRRVRVVPLSHASDGEAPRHAPRMLPGCVGRNDQTLDPLACDASGLRPLRFRALQFACRTSTCNVAASNAWTEGIICPIPQANVLLLYLWMY